MPTDQDSPPLPDVMTIDPATLDNAVLRRLIAEVQQDGTGTRAYDRVYNRHNRGSGISYVPRPRPASPARRHPRPAPSPPRKPPPPDDDAPPEEAEEPEAGQDPTA